MSEDGPASLTVAHQTIRVLQRELEETNSGLVALTLELEQRVDERTAELREAHAELQRTNSELLQLTLELEERVAQRTEEIRRLNEGLERRVRERTAELEAANKELEAFTYSVSHDLRAPLRHIDGFSKILQEDYSPELDATARHYLERIRAGIINMGRLVDDLLSLSRIGRRGLAPELTGLGSLVKEVLSEFDFEVKGREVEWRIEELPFVNCDPSLIKLVFQNLLSNALKFTRPRQVAVIQVGQTHVNGQRAIFVRDNGVGFSMKYVEKLFGVFQRLHRQQEFEGTGVGLATVQRIIHKHAGRVWAEGEINKGATFFLTLPGLERQGEPITKYPERGVQ
jgi:light-regulated signal transduction histidine kinase (bacteriophytochrome)